ncbi:MAG: hypothetical protein KIT60_25300 [Burkholderiaceae bacterium]|nr:hypothetical protein [Burkholderiaceae bacterium]
MDALFGRYQAHNVPHTVVIMNRTSFRRSPDFHRRASRPSLFGALEWEELPSLAQSLRRHELGFAGSAWTATQRLELFDFDDAPPPAPFSEPIDGLHVREIDGSEVFCHFFGRPGTSH